MKVKVFKRKIWYSVQSTHLHINYDKKIKSNFQFSFINKTIIYKTSYKQNSNAWKQKAMNINNEKIWNNNPSKLKTANYMPSCLLNDMTHM